MLRPYVINKPKQGNEIMALKVYGFTKWRAAAIPALNGNRQTRNIVAAHSIAEVMRLADMSRNDYNLSGSETGNADEVVVAMSEPGVVFWVEFDMAGLNTKNYKRDDSGLRAQNGTAS